jgi:hypothetical protein
MQTCLPGIATTMDRPKAPCLFMLGWWNAVSLYLSCQPSVAELLQFRHYSLMLTINKTRSAQDIPHSIISDHRQAPHSSGPCQKCVGKNISAWIVNFVAGNTPTAETRKASRNARINPAKDSSHSQLRSRPGPAPAALCRRNGRSRIAGAAQSRPRSDEVHQPTVATNLVYALATLNEKRRSEGESAGCTRMVKRRPGLGVLDATGKQ